MTQLTCRRSTSSKRIWLWLLTVAVAGVLLMAGGVSYVWWHVYRPIPFDQAVGAKLPAGATEFKVDYYPGFDGYEYYATAKLSRAEFDALIQSAGLQPNPPSLSQSSSPLEGVGPQVPSWWAKAPQGTTEVFYAPRSEGFIAAKYQDGRMYLRRALY